MYLLSRVSYQFEVRSSVPGHFVLPKVPSLHVIFALLFGEAIASECATACELQRRSEPTRHCKMLQLSGIRYLTLNRL